LTNNPFIKNKRGCKLLQALYTLYDIKKIIIMIGKIILIISFAYNLKL